MNKLLAELSSVYCCHVMPIKTAAHNVLYVQPTRCRQQDAGLTVGLTVTLWDAFLKFFGPLVFA